MFFLPLGVDIVLVIIDNAVCFGFSFPLFPLLIIGEGEDEATVLAAVKLILAVRAQAWNFSAKDGNHLPPSS